jgi:hypothetical protein
MSSMDDRGQAFEKKFALDQEQEFHAAARRNRMLGEWAAARMGLENPADYTQAVIKADFAHPGGEDVLRKVTQDLLAAGANVPEAEVRAKMDEFLAIAREQLRNE